MKVFKLKKDDIENIANQNNIVVCWYNDDLSDFPYTQITENSIYLFGDREIVDIESEAEDLSFEYIIKLYEIKVQEHLDLKAQEYGYDNISTAVTYADEEIITKFQDEGIAFRKWRSLVWDYCYSYMSDVENGSRELIFIENLINELPILEI